MTFTYPNQIGARKLKLITQLEKAFRAPPGTAGDILERVQREFNMTRAQVDEACKQHIGCVIGH